MNRLSRFIRREKIRTVHCFTCKAQQQITSFATSTFCPQCGAYIDLRDFKISGNFSRSIQTQGLIDIAPKGDVASSKLACGSALLRGKLQGNLYCTGIARIKTKNKILGGIEAHHLIIEKRTDAEFVRAIKAGKVEIMGKISARITADSVKIAKGGRLDGIIYAKSIFVDKGGVFLGELFIGNQELSQPDLIPSPQAAGDLFEFGKRRALAAG
jgi:cytoskeletal protein CcmA (bactofilin family)